MKYLKGSLHEHTTVSDGQVSPEECAEIYKNLGYDFIVFTDHNINYPAEKYIKSPLDDLICISGGEFEAIAPNHFGNMANIHLCGLGFLGDFIHNKYSNDISDNINKIIEEYRRLGAVPQVNHPNWGGSKKGYSFGYKELLDVKYPFLLEIVNYSDGGFNEGNEAFESVEYIWDVLLSYGRCVYGTMTDDAHFYLDKSWIENSFSDKVDYWADLERQKLRKGHTAGNGFVMVRAEKNEKSVLSALRKGDFYASNGMFLDEYKIEDNKLYVKVRNKDENARIILKGKMGLPLETIDDFEAVFDLNIYKDQNFVRVKVINGSFRTAYCQPVFFDGRNSII